MDSNAAEDSSRNSPVTPDNETGPLISDVIPSTTTITMTSPQRARPPRRRRGAGCGGVVERHGHPAEIGRERRGEEGKDATGGAGEPTCVYERRRGAVGRGLGPERLGR